MGRIDSLSGAKRPVPKKCKLVLLLDLLTSRTSTVVASASRAFSINSFTTLKTDVITCVLPNNRTVNSFSAVKFAIFPRFS